MGRFDEHVARQYITETVLALEYCHSKVRYQVVCFILCRFEGLNWFMIVQGTLKLYWHWSTATARYAIT
jgi:hypothetical protein